MVITGAKSEEKSEQAAKMYAKMIKKVGTPDVKLQDFKIQNIVGSCGVSFAISLESTECTSRKSSCLFLQVEKSY